MLALRRDTGCLLIHLVEDIRHGNIALPEFWVRIGNETRQRHGDDPIAYSNDRWS